MEEQNRAGVRAGNYKKQIENHYALNHLVKV
jgi:hypothetical protein